MRLSANACIDCYRRVLIFPKGNNVDHLSIYLDVADSTTLPYGWSRYAQFTLAIVNQIHSKYTIRKGNVSYVITTFIIFLQHMVEVLRGWAQEHDMGHIQVHS